MEKKIKKVVRIDMVKETEDWLIDKALTMLGLIGFGIIIWEILGV